MVQGDRNLNQPLQKLLLRSGSSPPDVFQRLVRLKKGTAVEQLNSVTEFVDQHTPHFAIQETESRFKQQLSLPDSIRVPRRIFQIGVPVQLAPQALCSHLSHDAPNNGWAEAVDSALFL